MFVGACSPGRTNDCRAFSRLIELRKWFAKLPAEYFIVGDNAYPLDDSLQIPFSGSQKKNSYNRAFCFYLSQLRIRVEMAFGLLTVKWRIFRTNLMGSLELRLRIIRVAMKLHNYVINADRLGLGDSFEPELEALVGNGIPDGNRGYLPSDGRQVVKFSEVKVKDFFISK